MKCKKKDELKYLNVNIDKKKVKKNLDGTFNSLFLYTKKNEIVMIIKNVLLLRVNQRSKLMKIIKKKMKENSYYIFIRKI